MIRAPRKQLFFRPGVREEITCFSTAHKPWNALHDPVGSMFRLRRFVDGQQERL
jgi:hypothetical protein